MLDYGFYNMDCMEGMKQFPDKYFDLAIVDPPYGAGFTENGDCRGWFEKYHQNTKTGGKRHFVNGRRKKDSRYEQFRKEEKSKKEKIINWDIAPDQYYFEELFRVSKNQIIWGGELFYIAAYTLFFDMAQIVLIRKLFDGNVRICLDKFQRKRKSF